MTHLAVQMYEYHAWANQTLFARILELPDEVYHKEIESVFPSIAKVVSHMYIVDQLWFQIITGKDMPEALDVEKDSGEGKGIKEMARLFEALSQKYKAFLSKQEDFETQRVLNIPWEGRCEKNLSEMVMHIVTHATYHRGNITAMLRQMGHPSVTTDFTRYWYASF